MQKHIQAELLFEYYHPPTLILTFALACNFMNNNMITIGYKYFPAHIIAVMSNFKIVMAALLATKSSFFFLFSAASLGISAS